MPLMYSKQNLASVAGIIGWMSCVVPRARPLVSHLWRAIHATPNGEAAGDHRPRTLIFKRRVEHAVHWLRGLLGSASRFKTQFALAGREETSRWSIVADASPFGVGAILYSSELVPQAYWASELGKWDLDRSERALRSSADGSCWLFSFRSSCSLTW